MIRAPAIAAGFFGFAIAQDAWVSRGLAFLLSPFAFSFGAILIGPRVLSVSELMVGFVTTSSSSLAHLSSFALFVFAFAFVVVRVVEGSRVVAQVFLIVCQVVQLEVGVLLKTPVGV